MRPGVRDVRVLGPHKPPLGLGLKGHQEARTSPRTPERAWWRGIVLWRLVSPMSGLIVKPPAKARGLKRARSAVQVTRSFGVPPCVGGDLGRGDVPQRVQVAHVGVERAHRTTSGLAVLRAS